MRVLFSVFFLTIFSSSFACGTLESRYNFYKEAHDDKTRFIHLRYLICDPIVEDFRGSNADRDMIIELVQDAQQRSDALKKDTTATDAKWKSEYYRNLALRLAIRFNMHKWDIKFKDEIIWAFDPLFGLRHGKVYDSLKNLETRPWLTTDDGLSLSEMAYASKLNFEILELIVLK
ncbi:MAG: hypothetical protein JXQ87_08795 [Bacteroidia bacterium]